MIVRLIKAAVLLTFCVAGNSYADEALCQDPAAVCGGEIENACFARLGSGKAACGGQIQAYRSCLAAAVRDCPADPEHGPAPDVVWLDLDWSRPGAQRQIAADFAACFAVFSIVAGKSGEESPISTELFASVAVGAKVVANQFLIELYPEPERRSVEVAKLEFEEVDRLYARLDGADGDIAALRERLAYCAGLAVVQESFIKKLREAGLLRDLPVPAGAAAALQEEKRRMAAAAFARLRGPAEAKGD